MSRFDLLLVNPGVRKRIYGKLTTLSAIEPPIWAASIASFVRENGYSVKIIDAEAENWSPGQTAGKIAKDNPLLVSIIVLGPNPSASSTPKMTAVSETLNMLRCKAPHIKTMVGGLHPSALPEQTLEEEKVDFVCQGEGFYTTLYLLDALEDGKERDLRIDGLWFAQDGKIMSNPRASLVKNLDDLPMTASGISPNG